MRKILGILAILLCVGGNTIADNAKISQKYSGGGGWKDPFPGPDSKEIALIAGRYRVWISGGETMWNGKIITLKNITVVPVKDVYPRLSVAASITVPIYWDTMDQLPLENFALQQGYDPKSKRTRIVGFACSFGVNLKEGGMQRYEFDGRYIEPKRSFAGMVKHNGASVGAFIAEKIKSKD